MYYDVLLSFPVLAVTSGRNHLVIQVDLPRLRLSGQLIWIETLWLMCENTRLPLLSVSRRGSQHGPWVQTHKKSSHHSLGGYLVLVSIPIQEKKWLHNNHKKIQPPVYGGGGAIERALKRLVFGNTSDGLIHHHQKHPIWFVCVTLLLRHTVAVIRGYDQNNSQWLNMPRCALHKIERRCCFRIAERRSKAYERFFGGSLSGVREKDSKQ